MPCKCLERTYSGQGAQRSRMACPFIGHLVVRRGWSRRRGAATVMKHWEAALRHSVVHVSVVMMLALRIATVSANASEPGDAGCLTGPWIDDPMAFLIEATKKPLPDVCIRIIGQRQLDSAVSTRAYEADGDAAAAFVPSTREILLAENLDFSTVLARSYLVHELVHSQQHAAGSLDSARCMGIPEGEAYALQARYLRRHALLDEAFLFQMIGMMQSSCGIDY